MNSTVAPRRVVLTAAGVLLADTSVAVQEPPRPFYDYRRTRDICAA